MSKCFCGLDVSIYQPSNCSGGCDFAAITTDKDDPDGAMASGCECAHHMRTRLIHYGINPDSIDDYELALAKLENNAE